MSKTTAGATVTPGPIAHSRSRQIVGVAARLAAGLGLAVALVPLNIIADSGAGAAPPPPGGHPTVHSPKGSGLESFTGHVATLGTQSFSLAVGSNKAATTETVNVSSATTYHEPGVKGAGLADIVVGDKVRVTGQAAGAATMNAASVSVYMAKAVGKVTSLGSQSFVLRTGRHASLTVNVSTLTSYREPKVKAATFANVVVGEKAEVIGAQAIAGTVNAVWVFIVPAHLGTGDPGATTTTTAAATGTTTAATTTTTAATTTTTAATTSTT